MNNITQTEAYAILKLPIGAHKDAVENSYKKLASHWLPDKHHNSPDSINTFSDINKSFSMLSSNKDAADMSYAEMLKQYYKVTNTKSKNKGDTDSNVKSNRNKKFKNNDVNSDSKSTNTNGLLSDNNNATQNLNQVHENNMGLYHHANNTAHNTTNNTAHNTTNNNNNVNNYTLNNQQKQLNKDEYSDNSEELMVASRSFAIEGNSLANQGLYSEAVQAFTKAINLNPTDFRFFGNRSFCHEREGQYEEALSDSNMSISLAPEWPKGYFRKAKALSGRKCYAEAEKCYLHVLSLDATCPDAKVELALVRALQLMEMGFGRQAAQKAIQECETVQAALDALLSNQISDTSIQDAEVNEESSSASFNNKDKHKEQFQKTKTKNSNPSSQPPSTSATSTTVTKQPSVAKKQQKQQTPLPPIPQHHYEQAQKQILMNKQQDTIKMNPRNPEGLTSLWVGNVLPEVKQEHLHKMFSKYGQVQSVKSIPEKFCAFINFVDKDCAGKAMQNLQAADVFGQKLLIKFPDHPVNGEKSSNKSNSQVPSSTSATTSTHNNTQQYNNINGNRTTGPVNGDECYFWRTTGCQFTGVCRYKHIPGHKGIDKKPWHKSK